MRMKYRPKSIRTTLLFWFLTTVLVPLFIITGIAPIEVTLWSRMLFFLGAGVVACVIAMWLARSILRPIISMREMVDKMQAGEFSGRCQIESRDEIGFLVKSLNAMANARAARDASLSGTPCASTVSIVSPNGTTGYSMPGSGGSRTRDNAAALHQESSCCHAAHRPTASLQTSRFRYHP